MRLESNSYQELHKYKIIAVDCRLINSSGIGTYLRNILSILITIRQDWQWILFGQDDILNSFLELAPSRVEVRHFQRSVYTVMEHVNWLFHLSSDIDLLWVPHYTVPLITTVPVCCTIHDVIQLAHPQLFSKFGMQTYAKIFMGRARRSDGVAFVSDFTFAEFQRLVGPPRGHSVVTSAGVATTWSSGGANTSSKVHNNPYIVCVGNLRPHKNLERLIDAFGKIMNTIPHDLVIIGKEQGIVRCDSSLYRFASQFGSRIQFLGWIDDDALANWIRQADLLVMPSLYEGFSLPPLEALSLGCPVAVSRTGALPDVLGEDAFFFDPWDVLDIARTLEKALTDEDTRSRYAKAGQQRVSRYKWSHPARQTETLFELVLNKKSR